MLISSSGCTLCVRGSPSARATPGDEREHRPGSLLGAKRDGQPFCAAKQAAHSAGSSALSRTTPGRARQTGQSGPRPVIQVRESQRRGGRDVAGLLRGVAAPGLDWYSAPVSMGFLAVPFRQTVQREQEAGQTVPWGASVATKTVEGQGASRGSV